jgi:tetratricopeptide (TPR) repeat protein
MSKLLFIFLLFLFVGSWISIINRTENEKTKYKFHVNQFKKLEEKGIYIDALHNVEALMNMDPKNLNLQIKYAELNRKLGNERVFIEKCEELTKSFQNKEEPFVFLASHYVQKGRYSEAIQLLKNAKNVDKKENINKLYKQLQGKFDERYEIFEEIKDWHGDVAFIKVNNQWAKVLPDGTTNQHFIYQETGGFDSKQAVFPAKVDYKWFYFDRNENRKLVSKKDFDFLGTFSDGLAPVKRSGKAGFINRNFKEYAMQYKFTGAFKNGIAAVLDEDGNWGFINKNFKYVTNMRFDDIVRDDYGFCSEYGVSFVKKDGVYFLVNLKGKRIGDLEFDDVQVFESIQYAAVKKNNKWGYVNRKGNWVIKPTFQNARSFSIGLGGVQQNELWGFVDTKGNYVIEPQFSEVKPFSRTGIAPIREGNTWHFIQLYEYVK